MRIPQTIQEWNQLESQYNADPWQQSAGAQRQLYTEAAMLNAVSPAQTQPTKEPALVPRGLAIAGVVFGLCLGLALGAITMANIHPLVFPR